MFDGFAYNKANSVNLWKQQTDHKSMRIAQVALPQIFLVNKQSKF